MVKIRVGTEIGGFGSANISALLRSYQQQLPSGGAGMYNGAMETADDSPDAKSADVSGIAALTPDEFPLDRYVPVEVIGKGTVGTIYLCLDRRLHRKKVAVKVLRAVPDEELVSFQQEARATSRLNHRNIIAVYDFGTTESGVAYMAMEYVEGRSLDREIRTNGPLDPDRALKIAVCLADALAYAHSCGIFHRDIKTSNILLVDSDGREPEVRLIDFGVAAINQAGDAIKVQGKTIVGTPQYMSPDQCFGLSYDERSEVYSLGCVLFEMLTGKPPFQGETALQLINRHASEKPPTLAAAHGGRDFENRIEALLARCLAKNREDRYQSMYSLKADLVKVIDRAYSMTLDNLIIPKDPSSKHDRDPVLSSIMVALVCFIAACWLAYLQIERYLFKSSQAPTTSTMQRKVDMSLPSLDEYTASPEFMRTYHYGRLVIQANHKIADEDLKTLSTERDLSELRLHAPVLKGDGFRYLAATSLGRLVIKDAVLSEQCLKGMTELKNLKNIELHSCQGVTRRGIKNLAALPMELLAVPDCSLGSDSLVEIARMKALASLDFSNNGKIDAAALKDVGAGTALNALWVSPDQLNNAGFKAIASLNNLQVLAFAGRGQLTERELLLLKDLPKLNRIVFRSGCATPESLKALKQFENLDKIELSGIEYGDAHMAALDGVGAKQLTLIDVIATDKGFEHILNMPHLQRVSMRRCLQIPSSSITELSKRMKNCDIVVL
jgi:serine/threonine protein kinase